MGNKPFSHNSKTQKKKKIKYKVENPYKEGWLWKQSRHLKKWRKRWIVIQGDFIYTFSDKQIYENPTEIIDLRNFTFLSKEITYEEPSNGAQQKFKSFTKKFTLNMSSSQNKDIDQHKHDPIHLILLSDLNNDESFIFKCNSKKSQTHWIYSFERALEYKSNLLQNIIPSSIIKYIVSLYFLSYERLLLSTISIYFNQLFGAQHYNNQYYYYHDAIYWSQHFKPFCKIIFDTKQNRKIQKEKKLMLQYDFNENKQNLSLEEMQFNEASFVLTSGDWAKFTKNERFQLKYFFIFYHEFSALNYQRIQKKQSDLSSFYIRSRSKNRRYQREKDRTTIKRRERQNKHREYREEQKEKREHKKSHRSKAKKINKKKQHRKESGGDQKYAKTFVSIKDDNNNNNNKYNLYYDHNIRDKSRRYSEDDMSGIESDTSNISDISSICGDHEIVSEEIMDELNRLYLKYENIRLDGYEWNDFFNRWISYPYIKSLFVSCNIQSLYIGASNFYDESASMMTQLANNAIDLKIEKVQRRNRNRMDIIHNKYNESTFWNNGGIQWLCHIFKYSYSMTSHLSTIRTVSLRDSNFTDKHLKLLCNAINSRKYESSKSLTIRKLNLSKNFGLTDNSMQLLFTTIGNKLQYLEELELNDIGITDNIGHTIYDFYCDFHSNLNVTQLYSISLLGNLFTSKGFKMMNKLFEDDIIDENKFIDGDHKTMHIGCNGRMNDIKHCKFDMRLHIVVANMNGKLSD